jgi:arylsulfatase A-like enzyme
LRLRGAGTIPAVKLALLALAAAVAALGGAARDQAVSAPAAKPNVVVIMTDDQTVESLRVMANVQRVLAARGTTFTNSFVSYALCCPSRATYLTGQYPHNHGVLGNAAPNGGYYKLDGSNTLPVWLQRAGYFTAHIGKYLNGYGTRNAREIPPGWNDWQGAVDPTTYRFYNYTVNENGTPKAYGTGPAMYQTDVFTEKALAVIRARAPQQQPFFLSLAYLAPHSGGPRETDDPANIGTPVPAPRHRNRFAAEALPQPPSFNEADMSDKPAAMRNRPLLGPARIAAVRESYQQRLESLLAVDEGVARIVAELERLGELDRTLIVFTADNGFFHGEHRVPQGKVLLYEPSIRVPLIVAGLDVRAGRRSAVPVSNVDLAPTIAAFAGATPLRRVDGRSLRPILRDPNVGWGRDLLIEREPGAATFAALHTPRFVYAEHGSGEKELYDLQVDPDQLVSRHADPGYAAVRTGLAQRLFDLRRCAGDACRRGPLLLLAVRGAAPCVRTRFTVGVFGAELELVQRVELSVGGVRRAVDAARPYVRTFPRRLLARRFATLVRARAFLADGRVVTYDRRVRRCT